ncbi:MAG: hypothetical protein WBO48_06145, partial [Candidatus Promineifilaceae bacterium]
EVSLPRISQSAVRIPRLQILRTKLEMIFVTKHVSSQKVGAFVGRIVNPTVRNAIPLYDTAKY